MTQSSQAPAAGGKTALSANDAGILLLRVLAHSMVAVGLLFVANNYLIFWRGWPGLQNLFAHHGWFGVEPLRTTLDSTAVTLGWVQSLTYLVPIAGIVMFVVRTRDRSLQADAEALSALTAYIIRAAFWAIVFIGLADSVISFLRVEGLLAQVVGEDLATDLGRSSFRGSTVHYPLIGVALVVAYFSRALGFTWLALLIVAAEMQIVLTRFVFSYEQAFMSDLVRFWYGGLFLFASAHTLLAEGHVRVDILYAGFSARGKAWSNTLGSVVLGLPLCWVILTMGLRGKASLINNPLLNFEVTQQGYGLYVKYFMAGFLVIYAISMLVQFTSYFLSNVAVLVHEKGAHPAAGDQRTEF